MIVVKEHLEFALFRVCVASLNCERSLIEIAISNVPEFRKVSNNVSESYFDNFLRQKWNSSRARARNHTHTGCIESGSNAMPTDNTKLINRSFVDTKFTINCETNLCRWYTTVKIQNAYLNYNI